MSEKKIIRIIKGNDPYLEVTPLAAYCLERGWKVVGEYVDIIRPQEGELKQFEQDVRDGKIVVLPEIERKK